MFGRIIGLMCLCFAFAVQAYADVTITKEKQQELIHRAALAAKKAYAPYSHYHVGAAILTASGEIYDGCNIENASYSATICAERAAVFKAVSECNKEWVAMALVTKDGGAPCGCCRQVINEFNPNLPIFIANEKEELVRETPLSSLLTHAFGPANLQ